MRFYLRSQLAESKMKMQIYSCGWTLFLVYSIQKTFSLASERIRVFKFTKVITMQTLTNIDEKPPISTESASAIACAALLMQYGPFSSLEYYDKQSKCRSYHEAETVNSLISKMNIGWFYYNANISGKSYKECRLDAIGTNYRGKINTTTTGKQCMVWNAKARDEYKNLLIDQEGPDILNTNYCRNPDRWYQGMWCFTTVYPYWELCDVPYCQCYI